MSDCKVIKIRITDADLDAAEVARRFRENVEQHFKDLEEPRFCSLDSISAACVRQIDYQRPIVVSQMSVQYDLAIFWLQKQRQLGRLAKLRWLWQQLRALW